MNHSILYNTHMTTSNMDWTKVWETTLSSKSHLLCSSPLSRMLSTASTVVRCPICLLLAFLPGVPDGRLRQLELAPLQAAPWQLVQAESELRGYVSCSCWCL